MPVALAEWVNKHQPCHCTGFCVSPQIIVHTCTLIGFTFYAPNLYIMALSVSMSRGLCWGGEQTFFFCLSSPSFFSTFVVESRSPVWHNFLEISCFLTLYEGFIMINPSSSWGLCKCVGRS